MTAQMAPQYPQMVGYAAAKPQGRKQALGNRFAVQVISALAVQLGAGWKSRPRDDGWSPVIKVPLVTGAVDEAFMGQTVVRLDASR